MSGEGRTSSPRCIGWGVSIGDEPVGCVSRPAYLARPTGGEEVRNQQSSVWWGKCASLSIYILYALALQSETVGSFHLFAILGR